MTTDPVSTHPLAKLHDPVYLTTERKAELRRILLGGTQTAARTASGNGAEPIGSEGRKGRKA